MRHPDVILLETPAFWAPLADSYAATLRACFLAAGFDPRRACRNIEADLKLGRPGMAEELLGDLVDAADELYHAPPELRWPYRWAMVAPRMALDLNPAARQAALKAVEQVLEKDG